MKKLMIAAAIVCAAAFAQAATVSWTVSQVAYSDSNPYVDSSTAESYIGFLVDANSYASADDVVAALIKDGSAAAGVIYYMNGTDVEFEGAHDMQFKASKQALKGGGASTAYTAGQIINAYSVIFDAASAADADNYMVAYKENLGFNQSLNLGATGFSSQAANEWVAVPEPTSGLLLLLGVAGLALKRKRA